MGPDLAYDQRGNVKSDKRTISGIVYTATTYEYDLADRIFKVNYPSGRIVTYNRDTTGRITQVTTKKDAAAASVTLANTVVRLPLSNIVKSMVYGTHDGAGNMLTDNRLGPTTTYTYNKRNRLASATSGALL